jgi:hypothetical protein
MKLNKTEAKIVKIGAIAATTLFFGVQLTQAHKSVTTEPFNELAAQLEEVDKCFAQYPSGQVNSQATCKQYAENMVRIRKIDWEKAH